MCPGNIAQKYLQIFLISVQENQIIAYSVNLSYEYLWISALGNLLSKTTFTSSPHYIA